MEEVKSVDTCPICYEEYGGKDISITKCGHKFHTSCLIESIRRQTDDNCPYCRSDISISTTKQQKLLDIMGPGTYSIEQILKTIREKNIPLDSLSRNIRTTIEEHILIEADRKERDEEYKKREKDRVERLKSCDINKFKLFTPGKSKK